MHKNNFLIKGWTLQQFFSWSPNNLFSQYFNELSNWLQSINLSLSFAFHVKCIFRIMNLQCNLQNIYILVGIESRHVYVVQMCSHKICHAAVTWQIWRYLTKNWRNLDCFFVFFFVCKRWKIEYVWSSINLSRDRNL